MMIVVNDENENDENINDSFIVVTLDNPLFEGLIDMIRIRLHFLAEEMHAIKSNEYRTRSGNRVRDVILKIMVCQS